MTKFDESNFEMARQDPATDLNELVNRYNDSERARGKERDEERRTNDRGCNSAVMSVLKLPVLCRTCAHVTLGVLLLVSCVTAAPVRSREERSIHNEKDVRSYLQTFGYLRNPEVGNLLMGDVAHSYEDDFRIAIKTLQEFGGIPVTGVVDHETKQLLRRKRCGRPDREPGSEEQRRRKRFAVHVGGKWKHTNITWRLRLYDENNNFCSARNGDVGENDTHKCLFTPDNDMFRDLNASSDIPPITMAKIEHFLSSLSQSRRPSKLDPSRTREVLARALDVWQQASRLTFTEINSDEADIVVSFAKRYHNDAYPFDGRGSILAHAFYPGSGQGGDAHFDDDELWLLSPNNDDDDGTSLLAVAAHEFGHALGLAHSSVKGALMFPWYQGIQPNFVLPDDDRNGIQQMYGSKVQRTWGKIPYYRTTETTPPTTTTTTTTTTTRRPYVYYPERHPDHRTYTHTPSRYPSYPSDRHRPERPYYPDRRYNYNRTHHNPRHEATSTYRPHYPHHRQDYPSHPRQNHPTSEGDKYPKRTNYPVRPTTARPAPSDKPDTCDTTYDAVSVIRGELFIFKNRYHWRIGSKGLYPGYPTEISRMWSGLPSNLTHVDAVYERPDRKIAFFVGKQLYLFDSQYLLPGYPINLARLGLPDNLEKLDAAMVWGYNGKTYFYSGTMYWKFDEDTGMVEPDYPRDMAMWKGVGYNIDSVFQWKDGKTYFFKGKGFWKFNDILMRVEEERQHASAPFWMNCPMERAGRRAPYRAPNNEPEAPGSTLRSPSKGTTNIHDLRLYFTTIVLMFIRYAHVDF